MATFKILRDDCVLTYSVTCTIERFGDRANMEGLLVNASKMAEQVAERRQERKDCGDSEKFDEYRK